MNTPRQSDLIVVGAGPCGLAVGIAAKQAGLSCTIVEQGCVTRAISLYPIYGTFFSTPDKLTLGGVPFVTAGEKPTRDEALRYYREVVERFELDVRQYERVVAIDGSLGDFLVRTEHAGGAGEHRACRIVIATGYFDTPNLLNVPGEELPKVSHWYREGAPYFQQRVLVVGGGNSAVEAALDLARYGARVSVAHFESTLDSGIKPWVMPEITRRIESGEIATWFCCRVTSIDETSVTLRNTETGEEHRIDHDFVFAMTGWTPDAPLLRALGVSIDPETYVPKHDSDTFETDVPGVYVAGVLVTGSNKTFIENGREHGAKIVASLRP
ncbi:MAG TPA: YpdA family putative bacillithiol disulfide reductase [Longimicrobiales bacterium]|nr:YpdA family putative bacillithiol disulfide reductase [Longimicrobiales bacterium]